MIFISVLAALDMSRILLCFVFPQFYRLHHMTFWVSSVVILNPIWRNNFSLDIRDTKDFGPFITFSFYFLDFYWRMRPGTSELLNYYVTIVKYCSIVTKCDYHYCCLFHIQSNDNNYKWNLGNASGNFDCDETDPIFHNNRLFIILLLHHK